MRRPLWWVALCVFVLVAAPLATLFGIPATVVSAEPSAPAALRHDEVVVLSTSGQIQAVDLYPQPGMVPGNWDSGADTGWQYIAAGDFNGDGDQEIVAIGGSRIKVFDPFVQPGRTAVQFERILDSGRQFRLVTTGDFDGDGKDEIASTATDYPSGNAEALRVYDGGADGNTWSQSYVAYYGAPWQALATGDFNLDGADDLAMARNPIGFSPFLGVYSGLTWGAIAEGTYGYPWITLAAGKLSSASAPDQLAILRTGVGSNIDSVLMFTVSTGGFSDVFPGQYGNFRFNPNFTSLALGTLVSGRERQLFVLRDPQGPYKTSLLMLNPSGVPLRSFELPLDYGYYAWNQVRTGDVNGNGVSEVVILRSDRFRVFTQPQYDDGYIDHVGAYRVQPTGSDWPVMVIANLDGPGIPAGPSLNVAPASLSFDLDYGATSPVRTLAITNSGTPSSFAWQAQVTQGSEWLLIDTAGGTTPGQVKVSVRTNVTPGNYTGNIRISTVDSSVKNSPVDVPVTFNLANPGFVALPQQLTIVQEIGGPIVTRQVRILRSGLPTNWTATALPLGLAANVEQMIAAGRITVKDGSVAVDGQTVAPPDWLVFTPQSGTTDSTMTVSVQPATPGRYRAAIIVAAQDASVNNPIQWVDVNAFAAEHIYSSFLPLTIR